MAGLLTYSPFARLPVRRLANSGNEWAMVLELTAAGQSGIYTRFPFNHPGETVPGRTKSGVKVEFGFVISKPTGLRLKKLISFLKNCTLIEPITCSTL